MSDGTTLNVGTGGDVIMTEQVGGAGTKYPVSKIYTGALDVNGGPVTPANPFDVRVSGADSTGAAQALSVSNRNGQAMLVVTSPDLLSQNDTIIQLLTDIRDALQRLAPP